jgi:hypothetical protein
VRVHVLRNLSTLTFQPAPAPPKMRIPPLISDLNKDMNKY